jgi:hypothetical protein
MRESLGVWGRGESLKARFVKKTSSIHMVIDSGQFLRCPQDDRRRRFSAGNQRSST